MPGKPTTVDEYLAALPPDRRSTLEAVRQVLGNAEVKKKFLSDGTETVGMTHEQSESYIRADIAKWSRLVKEANIRPD